MMGHRERMLQVLVEAGAPLCDDCVVEPAGMRQRQQARSRGLQLEEMSVIRRGRGACSSCGKHKTVSVPTGVELPAPVEFDGCDKPWHWEGNVQAALVSHLLAKGWELMSQANTATKEVGIDVVAIDPVGRTWWITVKGYPEQRPDKTTRAPVQARHWFAGAMFDVVQYRTKDENTLIGVAMPAPFKTYIGLSDRSVWLQDAAQFSYFWVHEDGAVLQAWPAKYESVP